MVSEVEVRRTIVVIVVVAVATVFDINIHSQECHFVHPLPPPAASDFPSRPTDSQKRFVGPVIRAFQVQCWSAEPSAPQKCIGGTHGTQKVSILVPINELVDPKHIDTSFRQQVLTSFSTGGWSPVLKSEDLPPGLFVSFKGHPIFKITEVRYPAEESDPVSGTRKIGVRISAEFVHEPSMGECYFYAALWAAVK
jgi:hypothetical protein